MRSGDHRETKLSSDFLKPGWEKFCDLAKEGNGGKTRCRADAIGGLKREGGTCGVGLGSEAESMVARLAPGIPLSATCSPSSTMERRTF